MQLRAWYGAIETPAIDGEAGLELPLDGCGGEVELGDSLLLSHRGCRQLRVRDEDRAKARRGRNEPGQRAARNGDGHAPLRIELLNGDLASHAVETVLATNQAEGAGFVEGEAKAHRCRAGRRAT